MGKEAHFLFTGVFEVSDHEYDRDIGKGPLLTTSKISE